MRGVESEMRSIGEMARDSGLNVSALRFYDGAGVLVPAWVDPVSGYRWYGPEQLEESQLLAGCAGLVCRWRTFGWYWPDGQVRTPTWCGSCSRRICAVSNSGCPMPAMSSPRSERYSNAGEPHDFAPHHDRPVGCLRT